MSKDNKSVADLIDSLDLGDQLYFSFMLGYVLDHMNDFEVEDEKKKIQKKKN